MCTQGIATKSHSQGDIEQKEYEGHKQMYDQLYTGYQSLTKHFRQKDEEVNKLKSERNELLSIVDKQNIELSEIKQELESKFIQEQYEKLIMVEKDRDTATAMMLDHKELEEKTHSERNAKVTEMRNNYLLLMSQVQSKDAEIAKLTQVIDSKDVKIAELNANKKDLDSRPAQVHARAVRVDGNKETELFQGSSCESTPSSPSRSALPISTAQPLPEKLILREKELTITKQHEEIQQLRAQLMKSSGGTGGTITVRIYHCNYIYSLILSWVIHPYKALYVSFPYQFTCSPKF